MRIAKEELEYLDITWFAVDKQGRIIELSSAGSGHIPEFICKSKENAEILENYFENTASRFFVDFPEKGLYYFDAYDSKNRTTNYIKNSSPSEPILITQLPAPISEILSNNRLDIDVESVDSITVEHAYSTRISFRHLVPPIIKGQFPLNLKTRYFSIDFKTKIKFRKIMNIFKKNNDTSFMEIKSTVEVVDQTEISKEYYKITTSQGEFLLYIVYRSDIIFFDKGDLYSIQISRKNETAFDFNDRSGVWIEV